MRRHQQVGIALAIALPLVGIGVVAAGDSKAGRSIEPHSVPAVPGEAMETVEDTAPGVAGVRVFLDPETGEVRGRRTDPENLDDRRQLRERLNTYGGDLIQERLPEGGFKVDLRGRFQSAVVATIDPETDEVTIDCISRPADKEIGDER